GRFLTKFVHKICDQGLVLSESSVTALKDRGFTKPISVIYNGVDIMKFRNASAEHCIFKDNAIIVGYIGSIEAFQGVDSFCKIAKQVKNKRSDITFVVVGGDKAKHNILKKIAEGTVDFYEFFPPELVPSIYKRFDCLLMTRPSLPETESAVPLKPIEALGSHIPVISTKVGGMVELKKVLDSTNIHLFDTLEEIESYLLNLDFGNMLFHEEKNLAMFDVAKQANRLEDVYEVLINE
uniref:glycosyltransferase family 4 protein n=1 Tax=Aliivibrio sp. SR45-2 TaxID=2760931 RepID=UPI001C71DAFB